MQRKSTGSIVVLATVLAIFAGVLLRGFAQAEPQGLMGPGQPGELVALSSDAEAQQQVTVIDTRNKVMSVYHIEHATGAITLRSVRNIEADLMMDEFNTGSPLPREIRAMLTDR